MPAADYTFAILGAGATGLSLLLLLQDAGVDLRTVLIVDPHFDGGDLAREWTTVLSNTPWSKTAEHVALTCPSLSSSFETRPDPSRSTPLVELAQALKRAAGPALARVRQVQGQATRADWSDVTGRWSVRTVSGPMQREEFWSARRLVLATGAEPRSLDLPIPSIPLKIALDRERLRYFVKPNDTVLVVGTMHSGALVMRNVADCSGRVVALYNTPTPFTWDRAGAYDGLKGEAAEIADAISRGDYGDRIRMWSTTDTAGVLRAGREAEAVVYAMGFRPRGGLALVVNGETRSATAYDGATGALLEAPAAWGFGVAYPNRAPDGVHWDVSVAAFLLHMKAQLPSLLAGLE